MTERGQAPFSALPRAGQGRQWQMVTMEPHPREAQCRGCCSCGDQAAATFCSNPTQFSLQSQAEHPQGLDLGAGREQGTDLEYSFN